jgi:hypothetical protein
MIVSRSNADLTGIDLSIHLNFEGLHSFLDVTSKLTQPHIDTSFLPKLLSKV